jgi:hypothetical protein
MAVMLAVALGQAACGGDSSTTSGRPAERPTETPPVTSGTTTERSTMKLRLRLDDREITATLIDSESTQDFVSLLPLTLTLDDLLGGEKSPACPEQSRAASARTRTKSGTLPSGLPALTSSSSIARTVREIPDPGITAIGRIDSGVEALERPGSRRVTVELARGGLR